MLLKPRGCRCRRCASCACVWRHTSWPQGVPAPAPGWLLSCAASAVWWGCVGHRVLLLDRKPLDVWPTPFQCLACAHAAADCCQCRLLSAVPCTPTGASTAWHCLESSRHATCVCLRVPTQAFPYFYVPYSNDLPSEPAEGDRGGGSTAEQWSHALRALSDVRLHACMVCGVQQTMLCTQVLVHLAVHLFVTVCSLHSPNHPPNQPTTPTSQCQPSCGA